MTIACQILERITIRSAKLDIELHRIFNSALITKSNMIKEILDILFLGDKKSV
jgi:protein associated with RNAse G/E